jgi:hypothetical protein
MKKRSNARARKERPLFREEEPRGTVRQGIKERKS